MKIFSKKFQSESDLRVVQAMAERGYIFKSLAVYKRKQDFVRDIRKLPSDITQADIVKVDDHLVDLNSRIKEKTGRQKYEARAEERDNFIQTVLDGKMTEKQMEKLAKSVSARLNNPKVKLKPRKFKTLYVLKEVVKKDERASIKVGAGNDFKKRVETAVTFNHRIQKDSFIKTFKGDGKIDMGVLEREFHKRAPSHWRVDPNNPRRELYWAEYEMQIYKLIAQLKKEALVMISGD